MNPLKSNISQRQEAQILRGGLHTLLHACARSCISSVARTPDRAIIRAMRAAHDRRLATLLLLLVGLARGAAGLVMCASSGPGLSGKQRRQLRSLAGQQEAAKTLRRLLCVEPTRSAEELEAGLSQTELVRCKFPMVRGSSSRAAPSLAAPCRSLCACARRDERSLAGGEEGGGEGTCGGAGWPREPACGGCAGAPAAAQLALVHAQKLSPAPNFSLRTGSRAHRALLPDLAATAHRAGDVILARRRWRA